MQITINITKKEVKHLQENSMCEMNACGMVEDIMKRVRRKIQEGDEK